MQKRAFELQDSLAARFARVARDHPQRMAIGTDAGPIGYAQLNARANAMAHAILCRGGAPGDRVAVLMAHDALQIAAMLAVLKVGRIVVVLHPADPLSRLRQLMEDCGARTILCDDTRWTLAREVAGKVDAVILCDGVAESDENPGIVTTPDDVAFFAYTSGSTGAPKAVMRTHGLTMSNALAQSRRMGLSQDDRIALVASVGGGQGITTAWSTFLNACSLWPFPVAEKGIARLPRWIGDNGITVYVSSSSLFRHFMRSLGEKTVLENIRMVKLGAERATSEDLALFQRHFPPYSTLFHTLGCTEAGNIAAMAFAHGDRVADGPLPVGYVRDDIEVLLMDDAGMPVTPGGVGEIVVRSRYLAAGYWRNAALTAERFSPDPEGRGIRLFRSGDLAQFDAHGVLHHCGRKDSRIKLRGHRVEPSEIEDALLTVSGVERAAVYGIEAEKGRGMRLAASVLFYPGQARSAGALRHALRAMLPQYMVPSSFVFPQSFPVSANGKINREQIRLAHAASAAAAAEPPRTETETLLAGLWADAFDLEEVGRRHDFFDLGGDSLIAATIAAGVYQAYRIEVSLGMFSTHPVLCDLARAIDSLREKNQGSVPALVRIPRNGPLPLSSAQERIWMYQGSGYCMAGIYRIRGPLDIDVLRECMDYVARRHEILRTNFVTHHGRPVAIVRDPEPVVMTVHDFSAAADPDGMAAELFKREAAQIFDIAKDRLLHFVLVRTREGEHRLLRLSHHILSDAASWNIYFRELALLYEAKAQGREPPLPDDQPLQYADFAAWRRAIDHPTTAASMEAVAWWKKQFVRLPRPLELPLKHAVPVTGLDPQEGVIAFGLEPHVSRSLDDLRRKAGATYYMSRLAVMALLVAADTNDPDVILGAYASHRSQMALQGLIGFFSNPIALRLRCHPQMTFREWLVRVRDIVVQTAAYSQLPYEELRRRLSAERTAMPALTAFFSTRHERVVERFAGLEIVYAGRPRVHMPWGFTFECSEQDEEAGCCATFDAGMYDPVRVRGFIERYRRLAAAAVRQPDSALHRLLTECGLYAVPARPASPVLTSS